MSETFEEGNHLVRVRAQVMIRDDSTGGWVPMGGGGLSNVSVKKVPGEIGQCGHDYLIFGKRISDQSVVLSCVIKKDFEYNKVMPTFHHWKTGEKKFGLTFQTAADARAFDKGLRTAVDELLDGITEPKSVHNKHTSEVGDDDVFMSLNLPVETGDSGSSSNSSTNCISYIRTEELFVQRSTLPGRGRANSENGSPTSFKDNYPYVQLQTVHEFLYQNIEGARLGQQSESIPGSLKKRSLEVVPPPPPTLNKSAKTDLRKFGRQRCRYCHQLFTDEDNVKGACEHAPDCVRSAIEEISCIRCARAMLYHCMSDSEGDFGDHPCECNCESGCTKRWLGLGLLSVLVPCLWLYPPLKGCHACGVGCGICGGRHRPAS